MPNSQKRQTGIYTESPRTHQPQRRPHSRIGTDAQIRDHHNPPILEICQPHLRATQTQRQTTAPSGLTEDQRPHLR